MKDYYVEVLVKRMTGMKEKLLTFVACLATSAIGFFGLFKMVILIIPAIGMGILSYYLYRNTNIEYEYCLFNDKMDFERIVAASSRKQLRTIELSEIEVIAPSKSHRMDSYKNNNSIKYLNYSDNNPDSASYSIIVRDKEIVYRIDFNPNKEMLDAVYRMIPSKVFIN